MDLIPQVGNVRGRFTNKDNRVARLISEWDGLIRKMERIVVRGRGVTESARCAYATLVMMETGIRVGNEGSAEGYICENKYLKEFGKKIQTYGLTTLKHKHVQVNKGQIILDFVGKKGVGQKLFITNSTLIKYRPDSGEKEGLWLEVAYPDLYKFVKKYVGRKYKPKDIRSAAVNLHFCKHWPGYSYDFERSTTKSGRKAIVREALTKTAEHIGHTLGVCRSAYMSKGVLSFLGNYRTDEHK